MLHRGIPVLLIQKYIRVSQYGGHNVGSVLSGVRMRRETRAGGTANIHSYKSGKTAYVLYLEKKNLKQRLSLLSSEAAIN
jgi:hypothetical protein